MRVQVRALGYVRTHPTMIGLEGAPSAFDDAYFLAQLALIPAWLVALFTVRYQRSIRSRRTLALVAAIASGVLLPGVWNWVFPAAGLEGAGRILFGFPLALINSVLSCVWSSVTSTDAREPRWPALGPFVVTAAVGVAGWVLFLLR